MSQAKNKPQDFVPDDCRGVIVKNKQDLLFLGRENLEGFRAFYQKTAQAHSARIADLQKQIDALSHHTPISLDPRYDDIIAAIYEIKNFDARMACINLLIDQKAQLATQRRQVSAKVGYLTHLMAEAKPKPCFAHLRPCDYFQVGDRVAWLPPSNHKSNTVAKGRFAWCSIDEIAGPSVFLTYCNEYFISNVNYHGLVLLSDYDFFQTHPDYLQLWLRVASAQLHLNRYDYMYDAFSQPPV